MNSIKGYTKMKPKVFTVLLGKQNGETRLVDVVGCSDIEECIEYIGKTQESEYSIKIIKEKKSRPQSS